MLIIFIYENSPTLSKFEILDDILKRTLQDTKYIDFYEPIYHALIEREKAMTTGIGNGISIPHCSSEYVDGVIASLSVFPKNIDFDAMDKLPVNIVVLILISRNNFDIHIKSLASVARFFHNHKRKAKILKSKGIDEIYNIILKE